VLDRRGHCGGLFANSKDAIHFAMFESEQRPQAVIMGLRGLRPEMEGAACLSGASNWMPEGLTLCGRPHL